MVTLDFPSRRKYLVALMKHTSSFIPEIVKKSTIYSERKNEPYLIAAGLSFVAKIKDVHGKYWALKMFAGDSIPFSYVNDLKNRYDLLNKFLAKNKLGFFLESIFFQNGVEVDGEIYPILLMEWSDGVLLDQYIKDAIERSEFNVLGGLVSKITDLSHRLHLLRIVHSDIHFENIIVRPNGDLSLLDYDDIWIDGHVTLPVSVRGRPEFQHPLREKQVSVQHGTDNFSFWITIISLIIVILDKSVWENLNDRGITDRTILFTANDFKNPLSSDVFSYLTSSSNQAIHNWVAVICNELLGVTSMAHIPPPVNPQALYAKYSDPLWSPGEYTMYDPKKRKFLKKT